MLLFQIVGDSYFSLSLVKKKRKYFGIVKRISSVRWGDNISETWKYTLVSSLNIIYDASHHPS
jgi:O-antigen/teichoic acid export membrane protein